MSKLVQDALLNSSTALPNGTNSVYSGAIDTGNTTGDFVAPIQITITAPALGVTPLPDAKTMKFDVVSATASDLTTGQQIEYPAIITQTGASNAGSVAASKSFTLTTGCKRYVGVKATGSAAGDASGSTFDIDAYL